MGPGSLVSRAALASDGRTALLTALTALLRAISEKLIPGIPEGTRVSILQQTDASDANTDDATAGASSSDSSLEGPGVLKSVIDKATAKGEVDQEINSVPT